MAEFWQSHQPGLRFTGATSGTPAFYAEVEEHRYTLEPHIREIARFEQWADKDVLDVGCGIATDGVQFARAGARYVGLDRSPTAVELARRRFELEGLQPSIVAGSATALPFDDNSFDLIWSHGVIHHIDDTEAAVAEFHRVLRPGGVALVMLYHRRSFNYVVTIMTVRRILACSLLVPGGTTVAARLSGEDVAVLDGHREQLRRYGRRYVTDGELFLSNNTDGPGNPLSKVYSREEATRLFARFSRVETRVRHLNLRLYPAGKQLERSPLGDALARRFGWHLYIHAVK